MGNDFFSGIEDQEAFEGRAPRLGLGNYLAEIVNMGFRHSVKTGKDYLEVIVKLLESDSPGFPPNSEAAVQIWPAPFKIHTRKTKSLLEAALPGQAINEKLCNKLIEEDLLCGQKLRIRVVKNAKGFDDNSYAVA